MEPQTVLDQIGAFGLVPVVAIERAEDALKLGNALVEGGLPCAEITFRTAAAEAVIRELTTHLPQMLVGAGTVLSVEQAERAVAAGARFIVTPGFDPAVVDWCLANQVPVTPGVLTPTEINLALAKRLTILKFFPAEAMGGIKVLKAIGAPYSMVKFIPTGGISEYNLADYLSLPMVFACGGSWLVERKLINEGKFAEITRLTQAAVKIVCSIRG